MGRIAGMTAATWTLIEDPLSGSAEYLWVLPGLPPHEGTRELTFALGVGLETRVR